MSLLRKVGIACRALVILLALLNGPVSAWRRAPPALEVQFAGCNVVRVADGRFACNVAGASIFDGAAHGPQPPGDRRLTLWVNASPDALVGAAVDEVSVTPSPSKGSQRMEVRVGRGARELVVTAALEGKSSEYRLAIVGDVPPEQAQLEEAMRLRAERRPEATRRAEALLEEIRRGEGASPVAKAKATGQLARLRMHGQVDQGIDLLGKAIDLDRQAGLVADEVADALVLVTQLIDGKGDLDGARSALDHIGPLLGVFPVGRAMAFHYRAMLFSAWGDYGTAHRLMGASELLADELDLAGHLADVYQEQMDMLDRLGRHDDAAAYAIKLERLSSPIGDACVMAQRFVNLGRHGVAMGAQPGGAQVTGDAERALERALTLFSATADPRVASCDDAEERWGVLVLLTQLMLDAGRLDDAHRYLDRARGEALEALPLRVGALGVLGGKLELARHRPDVALPSFDEALALSRDWVLVDLEVSARMGRAQALAALGRVDEADAAFSEADDRLNRWGVQIRLGDGKETFFKEHEDDVRRYLAFLFAQIERGGADASRWAREAACVARRSRARLVSSTERIYRETNAGAARLAAWRVARQTYEARRDALNDEAAKIHASAEVGARELALAPLRQRAVEMAKELEGAAAAIAGEPPVSSCREGTAQGLGEPVEGEVILVYHPLEGSWAGFAIAPGGEVAAKRLSLSLGEQTKGSYEEEHGSGPTRKAWRARAAEQLLLPFAPALAHARKLRIVASPPLGLIDFHELPVDGKALWERLSVSYGVDLPPARAGAPRGKQALIVIPASEELYRTVDEAEKVQASLKSAGFDVQLLAGAGATRRALIDAMSARQVDLLHYAGHSDAEGRDGWEGRLRLTGGEWLGVADILSLPRVPRLVVLSSCDSAKTRQVGDVEGLALAQAFLIAGAEVALASTRKTDDSFTYKVMSDLYGKHLPLFLTAPAEALHATMSDVRARPEMARVSELPPLRILER